MLDLIKKAVLGIAISALGIYINFASYYNVGYGTVLSKLRNLDSYSQSYLLLLVVLVISILFTFDLLPYQKPVVPIVCMTVLVFVNIPGLFKTLLTITFIVLFIEALIYEKRNNSSKQSN